MKTDPHMKDRTLTEFMIVKTEFQKWAALFQRIGLKPRRFLMDSEAVYISTVTGWFRLGFNKYSKRELNWVRRVLGHLEEHSFTNWAVPWQKTIVWEENNFCYLIQPWIVHGERFQLMDPASLQRLAEIMAAFYRSSRDYVATNGIEPERDRWSNIEIEWESALRELDKLKVNDFPEKSHGELGELLKSTSELLKENVNNWRNSGIQSLMEHQRRSGVLGHGRMQVKNIIWINDDYYLLNWESIAFQPRILDLAGFIINVAFWEPDWIIYLINEYSRIQPFWPEEYGALQALLKYPKEAITVFQTYQTHEMDRKLIKEATKELARKERCLGKVWRELGTQKRWAGNSFNTSSQYGLNTMPMVLSPVENWGNFHESADSVITVNNDAKLPVEVIERLSDFDNNRIIGGKAGDILKGSAALPAGQPEYELENDIQTTTKPEIHEESNLPPVIKQESAPGKPKEKERVVHWNGFPKS